MARPRALKVPLNQPGELYQNYATNVAMAKRAKDYVLPMLERARRNRKKLDERARRRYNQWALITDDQFYRGRANLYMPAVRKGVERLVTQWVRETFPTDRWWDVAATAPEFEQHLDGIRTLQSQQLRKMAIKRKARPHYRQLAIYGEAPLKYFWRYEEQLEPELVAMPDGSTKVRKKRVVLWDDPDVKVVDFFSFHVYPETVLDLDDAALVAEDMVVGVDDLKSDPDNYANLKEAIASAGGGTSGSDALLKRQERLRRLGITEDELNDKHFLFLTECYPKFDFKDGFGRVPAILTLAWESVVVRLQRNPYARAPYRVSKDAEMPDEWFAHARTEATDRLQIGLNDAMNQDFDASALANNPVVVIDPNYCEDYQAIAIYPGAKVPAPPDAVKFDRPPEAAYSQKEKIAYLNSTILENLGAPASSSASPAASGQPRGARTFGGMQMLQMLAGAESKEVVEFQEDMVWEPLLADIAKMNALFMDKERTLRMVGAKGAPIVVSRETFAGEYAYEWLGSATVQNQTVRSAQMLVAMNIVRGVQPGPTGYPDLGYIFRTYWEAQGLKDADRAWVTPGRQEPLDPNLENEVCAAGRAIEVAPRDNDAEHIVVHSRFRMTLPPESPEHQKLLAHEQAHYHQFLMKQQAAVMAQMPQQPPMNGRPTNGGPPVAGAQPAGARAGRKPSSSPQSGMGPVRMMMDQPGGVPGGV